MYLGCLYRRAVPPLHLIHLASATAGLVAHSHILLCEKTAHDYAFLALEGLSQLTHTCFWDQMHRCQNPQPVGECLSAAVSLLPASNLLKSSHLTVMIGRWSVVAHPALCLPLKCIPLQDDNNSVLQRYKDCHLIWCFVCHPCGQNRKHA